jgi:hypothetical protein
MPRALGWLALADFLERVRRRSFLIAALAMVVVATLYLPARDAPYITMTIGPDTRGIYDSAWIGAVTACLSSLMFSLAAFYLVRGSVERDEKTGFGQILAATPVTKIEYVLGKTVSNFCYLAALTGLIALSGAAVQLVRGEYLAVDPIQLLLPTLVIVWPTMLLVAAVAVLFECVPLLKGGLGSVAYFALYLYAVAGLTVGNSVYERKPDPLGVGFALREMSLAGSGTAGAGANPEPNIGVNTAPANIRTFDFAGIGWDTETLLARLAWASAALVAVLAAALFFSRFDPSRRPAVPASGVVPTGFQSWLPGSWGRNKNRSAEATQARAPDPAPGTVDASSLAPLDGRSAKGRFAPLVVAELKLMLKGRSRLWYAGALGIVAAGLIVSPEDARAVVLPIAWLWPLLLWSSLGCRENRFGTAEIVFSAPRVRTRGTLAALSAGAVVALLTASGVASNLALSGETSGLFALVAGALFVPALAVACGVLSGGSTLFEGVYLPLWYLGPLNKVAALDFAATSGPGHPLAYLALAAALVATALALRRGG